VADALSMKRQHSLNTVAITQTNLLKDLKSMGVQLVSHGQVDIQLSALTLQPSLAKEIRVNQETNPELQRIKQNNKGKSLGIFIRKDGSLRFQNCSCVPNNVKISKSLKKPTIVGT